MSNIPFLPLSEDVETIQVGINLEKVPEIFQYHVGTWKGEYIKTDSCGHFLRSFLGTFAVAIEGTAYHQVNSYEYPDGTQLQLDFEGGFEGGVLKLSSSSYSDFSAIGWDAGHGTIGFRATKTQDNAIVTFIETITLIDRDRRVRSTQSFKDGIFDGISFIEEVRLK